MFTYFTVFHLRYNFDKNSGIKWYKIFMYVYIFMYKIFRYVYLRSDDDDDQIYL